MQLGHRPTLCVHACMLSHFSHVQLSVTPWTIARQASLSMDSPGKNTTVGCHFLLQGLFLTRGLNSWLLQLLYWQADSLPLSRVGGPCIAKVKDGISDTRLWKVVASILTFFHLLLDHPLAGKPVSMLWAVFWSSPHGETVASQNLGLLCPPKPNEKYEDRVRGK